MNEDYTPYFDTEPYCAFVCENLVGCEEQCLASSHCDDDDDDGDDDTCDGAAYTFVYGLHNDPDIDYRMNIFAGDEADKARAGLAGPAHRKIDTWNYVYYKTQACQHREWLAQNWTGGKLSEMVTINVSITWSLTPKKPSMPAQLARLLRVG